MTNIKNQLLNEVVTRYEARHRFRRDVAVSSIEVLMGSDPQWPNIRRVLLKFFGNGGLLGDFHEVIREVKTSQAGGEL